MESQECVTPESRVCKDCGIEKPITCFYKKSREGQFFTSCKECVSNQTKLRNSDPEKKRRRAEQSALRRVEKKAEIKQYMANYYQQNREKVLARCNEYRERPEVKERETVRQKMYYAARSAEIQARRKVAIEADPSRRVRFNEYLKQHYKANKSHYYYKTGKRRAVKFAATPMWADLDAIKRIYLLAEKLSVETGIKHHVDHVIPLQGKNVCGLHVENNLQVIPAKQNLSKANKLIEG